MFQKTLKLLFFLKKMRTFSGLFPDFFRSFSAKSVVCFYYRILRKFLRRYFYGLTEKQKRFVDEYLIDLNATAAARRAGYKDPNKGRQLVTKGNISKYIQEQLQTRSQRTNIT